ncbi:LCP family protein [Kitasatospora sp. NPDC094015]|uniref:LCP family glycopolymer transferase n=1 Tax=Kitasatospora sp. NPDC094015 TaxID=3155205 RepID=UPI003322E363
MAVEEEDGERPPAREGGGRRSFLRRHWLALTAGVLAAVLLVGGTLAWLAYRKLNGNIRTDTVTGPLLEHESDRPTPAGSAENILLIGSDDRSGDNSAYGSTGGQRSDTVILLHLSADGHRATAVSIPRDVMVTMPPCDLPDGSRSRGGLLQFNLAFEIGGPACTIRTVEQLSGIRIDHHLILDFSGFKRMVDAVGGVEVCVATAIHDQDAKLDLAAGRQVLQGEQALGYVRARESLGNGSDTDRMGRQQQFLAALIRKVQSQGVLLNPTKLWPLLDAATSSITADPGLSRLGALYDLAQRLRAMPSSAIVFLTTPRRPYRYNANRDEFVQPQTDQLFAALRADQEVAVRPSASPDAGPTGPTAPPEDATAPAAGPTPTPGTSGSRSAGPDASPSPSAGASTGASTGPTGPLQGRTADQDDCAAG